MGSMLAGDCNKCHSVLCNHGLMATCSSLLIQRIPVREANQRAVSCMSACQVERICAETAGVLLCSQISRGGDGGGGSDSDPQERVQQERWRQLRGLSHE